MTTTSLKLPDDLKTRAAAAARIRGVTPHAFMIEAIRVVAAATEQRASFIADAMAADAQMRKTGKGYAADAVHKYIKDKVAGVPARKPKAMSWRG
ncbi:MAG: CopG family transcriptional regulator [Xanthomonadaceae bacterium]|nr:CopG family transcriptional regulator [Xanthomonadaceae bacterium]